MDSLCQFIAIFALRDVEYVIDAHFIMADKASARLLK